MLRKSIRISIPAALLIAGLPAVASAQPSSQPGTEGDAAGQPPPPAEDDKVKELVDRELARILTERAAKEAAEKAAVEDANKAAKDGSPPDITGQSGFMDTRLAFTLTNENVLVQPGQTIPSVPGWRFGTPSTLGTLFFDNYDTRYSGFETLSHATMYRDFHHDHFDAEAAIVIRINEISQNTLNLSDDGSYIVLSDWKDPTHKDPTRLSLTAFPVSADRFRLGYSYRLSWGGDPEYQRTNSATPGAKLQYDTEKSYMFIGAKSAVILDERTAEQKSALAFLAGGGYDVTPMVRVEANGGYFDRGYNELEDVNDQKVRLYGASAQVAVHDGMPVQSSVDYRLYKNNGEQIGKLFSPATYPGGVSWLAMSEFTVLGQTLKDPEKEGATTIQYGMAGDLNVRIKAERVRLRLDLSYRDLAFILHSEPSLPTYEDFPTNYKVSPDFFAAVGADKNWNDFLTVGIVAGIEQPATLQSPKGIPGGATDSTMAGNSTAVIRNNGIDTIITILPVGKSVAPEVALKGSGQINFGRIYAALLDVYYTYDPNQTEYQRAGCATATACPDAPFQYQFGHFNQLGFNLTLQARF